jgi:hypothetical protein
MNDAADYPAVINPLLTAGVCREKRLDFRKLPVRQPKPIRVHDSAPFKAVNHKATPPQTVLWVRVLCDNCPLSAAIYVTLGLEVASTLLCRSAASAS